MVRLGGTEPSRPHRHIHNTYLPYLHTAEESVTKTILTCRVTYCIYYRYHNIFPIFSITSKTVTPLSFKIKLQHGEVLVIDSLSLKIKLDAFKCLLGGGIQAHLHSNPLLQTIFGIEGPVDGGGGGMWENSNHRETRKGREAGRRSERDAKSSSRRGGNDFDGC